MSGRSLRSSPEAGLSCPCQHLVLQTQGLRSASRSSHSPQVSIQIITLSSGQHSGHDSLTRSPFRSSLSHQVGIQVITLSPGHHSDHHSLTSHSEASDKVGSATHYHNPNQYGYYAVGNDQDKIRWTDMNRLILDRIYA